ncbi:hypothetical protein NEOLEDRAFT_1245101 [Neolentinus lepideus HHB14362 ss-1]|uniref:Uncharacterized protein n=1 Tax=Neolentinus lepideus HHB14362 ss-1 TaxID=1314782 RepID=A0A165P854_9AGAM|nr:hypothetical protein NEOLEDRAFT_1245101 [Neolentinus lepideus HHB14362 ss-1]
MQGSRGNYHYFPTGPDGVDDDDSDSPTLSDGDSFPRSRRPNHGSILARLKNRMVSPFGSIFSNPHSGPGYQSVRTSLNSVPSDGSGTLSSGTTQESLSSGSTCVSITASDSRPRSCTWFNDDELTQVDCDQQRLKEIKKGKRPEKPTDYDTLLADITQDRENDTLVQDDGEWVGLEHTVELSRRDRRPSDCHTPTAGEYSKV